MRYVTLESSQRFLFYAVVTLSVVALAAAEGSVLYLALTLTAVVYGCIRAGKPPISRRLSNLILLLFFPFIVVDYAVLSGSFLLAMVHFLLLVQVLKILSERTEREEGLLYFVSLLNMCVAAVLTQALLFAVIFVVYMLTLTAGLVVFNIWRQAKRAELAGTVKLPSSLFTGLSFMSIFTLAFTILIFILLPRMGAKLFRASFGLHSTTGISAEVDLTSGHDIILDENVVAQVQFLDYDEPVDDLLYIRCVVLTHYDGSKWRRASPEIIYPDATEEDMIRLHERRYAVPRRVENQRWVFRLEEEPKFSPRWRERLVVRTFLNPTTDYFLPVVGKPERIEFFSRESPRDIFVSHMGTLYYPSPRLETCGYDTFTSVVRRDAPLASCFNYHRIDGVDYTQLEPESRYFWRSEVRELTERIINEAGADSPYEAAQAVAEHLRRNYKYTLNPRRNRPDIDPVVEFLFETKRGHCELFASAMAVMLRTVGIGARVVAGYRGGEWNDYGKFYIVRRKNAHCWVEVFLDDDVDISNGSKVGWVPLDPTPPYVQPPKGTFSFLSDIIAYIRLRWLNYVIFYDASKWQKVVGGMARRGRKTLQEASRWWRSVKDFFKSVASGRVMPIVALLVLVTGFVLVMRLLWRKGGSERRRKERRRRAPPPAILFYRRMLALAEKHGLRRPPSRTPYELLNLLALLWGKSQLNTLKFITEMFVKARYGGITPTEDEHRRLDEALALLHSTIRHRRP